MSWVWTRPQLGPVEMDSHRAEQKLLLEECFGSPKGIHPETHWAEIQYDN